jgi:hypothetical protein
MLTDIDPPTAAPGLPLLAAADMQDHLLVATNDLERLQRLLADASESLLGHFHGARAALEPLMGATGTQAEHEAPALDAAMVHLAGAITAMQFQDMASQLVEHTARRLRNCADRLAQEAFEGDEDGDAVVQQAPLRPNPVTQDEMDAGSVELF